MIKLTTITEQLLFSTVRIETEIGTGTGFFFDFILPNQEVISTIITNKHVVQRCNIANFYVHAAAAGTQYYSPSGRFEQVELVIKHWLIPHPNQTIDLCAIVANPLFNNVEKQGIRVFKKPLNENLILTDTQLEELNAVEDILMFGYPNALWDKVNNLPLIRKGITSTHPAIDFCGESITVIDIACFPGSSGSPVLIICKDTDKNKLDKFIEDSAILLGILAEGPRWDTEGKILDPEIPKNNQLVNIKIAQMMHLGYIIKAKEIKILGEAVKTQLRRLGFLTNQGLKYL